MDSQVSVLLPFATWPQTLTKALRPSEIAADFENRVVKDQVNDEDTIDLQHLRRFAKPKFLPPHVTG